MDVNEAAFRKLVGEALRDLFVQIDDLETDDLDVRMADGVVDTRFEDDSAVVLSQQVPAKELWLSANWKAWHFVFREGIWLERDSAKPMLPLLSGIFEEKLGFAVQFR
jgi:iron donor protein CyaY